MSLRNLLIRSGAVNPPSGINSWAGWPEHVRETLWRWNHTGRLSFRYCREAYPECWWCGHRFTRQATVAVLYRVAERNGASKYGHTVCDPCLIKRAEAVQTCPEARALADSANDQEREATCPATDSPASPSTSSSS